MLNGGRRFPPGSGAHFPISPRPPGCASGHAAAQRACAVHGAAAARPADPESEGNRMVLGPGTAASAHMPSPLSVHSAPHSGLPVPAVGGVMGHLVVSVAGAQDSGSDSAWGTKFRLHRGGAHWCLAPTFSTHIYGHRTDQDTHTHTHIHRCSTQGHRLLPAHIQREACTHICQ